MKRPIGLAVGTLVLGCLALAASTFTRTTAAATQEGSSVSQRVGGCALAGSWKQTAEGIGTSIWKIDNNGKATESGLGFATGTATLTGNRLRLDWKIADAWAGYYEWQLDSGCNSGEGELVFTKGRSGTHKTTVNRQASAATENSVPPNPAPTPAPSRRAIPKPTPKPTPTPSGPDGVSVSKFFNKPEYSPEKLDFGEVWNGQASDRIFHLTPNANGYVRVELAAGPFRVAEIRELGPEKMVGGKGTGPMPKGPPIGPIRDLKGRVTFPAGTVCNPCTASADVGNEVQVYLVFEPKFDLFQMTAGEKSATMKVKGPGPKSEWTLTVPLRGMFNGLIVGAAFTVDDRDILAVQGTQRIDVAVRLTGTDSVLQGTISGKNLPLGIQINPVPVTVNPAQTTTLKVAVFPNWGTLQPDAQARNIELVFDAGQKTSSATFSLTPLPGTVSLGDANRKDCGIESLGWLAQFYPTGRIVLSLSGSNFDLINNRNVIGIVNVAGSPVAYGIVHLKIGSGTPDYKQWDSSKLNVDFDSRFRKDDYLSAVQGPVTLTCHLIDFNSKMPF